MLQARLRHCDADHNQRFFCRPDAWNVFRHSDAVHRPRRAAVRARPRWSMPPASATGRPRADARIVSLVPSLTETPVRPRPGRAVVGRTAFCVHPDGRVKRAKASAAPSGQPRQAATRWRPPTSSSTSTRRRARWPASSPPTATPSSSPIPSRSRTTSRLYRLLGGLFGRGAEAEALCRAFAAEAEALRRPRRRLPERRVLYLIWKDPWMTVSADTYIARMLAQDPLADHRRRSRGPLSGGRLDEALLAEADRCCSRPSRSPSPRRHLEAFRAAHPEHAGKAHADRRRDGLVVRQPGRSRAALPRRRSHGALRAAPASLRLKSIANARRFG